MNKDGKKPRLSLIGALNGHTDDVMLALTGMIGSWIGVLTLAKVWPPELGAALTTAFGASVAFFGKLIKARLSSLSKQDRLAPPTIPVPVEVPHNMVFREEMTDDS